MDDYQAEFPTATACLLDDFEAYIAHLRMPVQHRKMIRTTSLLKRLFVEQRRRMKIIPNAWGEKPVLKLMFPARIRAGEKWRPIGITGFERRQMQAIREELHVQYRTTTAPLSGESRNAPPSRISSKSRT